MISIGLIEVLYIFTCNWPGMHIINDVNTSATLSERALQTLESEFMKVTKRQLRQIIREEKRRLIEMRLDGFGPTESPSHVPSGRTPADKLDGFGPTESAHKVLIRDQGIEIVKTPDNIQIWANYEIIANGYYDDVDRAFVFAPVSDDMVGMEPDFEVRSLDTQSLQGIVDYYADALADLYRPEDWPA